MSTLSTILASVASDATEGWAGFSGDLIGALTGAVSSGIDITEGLSGDAALVAQVLAGTQPPTALVGIVTNEMDNLVPLLSGAIANAVPLLEDQGTSYAWADAVKNPASLIWYLAAAAEAAPSELATAIDPILANLQSQTLGSLSLDSQDAVVILMVIAAVCALAAPILLLAGVAAPVAGVVAGVGAVAGAGAAVVSLIWPPVAAGSPTSAVVQLGDGSYAPVAAPVGGASTAVAAGASSSLVGIVGLAVILAFAWAD